MPRKARANKIRFLKGAFSLVLALSSGLVGAQDNGPEPLRFKTWKEQQVLEAQNQVLRASARILSLKTSKRASSTLNKELANGKLKKISETDTMPAAEQDYKRAQESLTTAMALKFEDYVEVYIPTLEDHPEALQKLSEKLSKEELTEIFKGLMRKAGTHDAKRNLGLMGSLASPSPEKIP